MFILDLDIFFIPDTGNNDSKEKGKKEISCLTFFCSRIFHKIVNFKFFFLRDRKRSKLIDNLSIVNPKTCY
jgi:hypothetical protein